MRRIIAFIFMAYASAATASIDLVLGENVVALAAKDAKVSMFSKNIQLPEGKQRLVVKFDSPVNPESVNQGKGRITSALYLISFHYAGNEKLLLTTDNVTDERQARQEALNPHFRLMANRVPVKFERVKIEKDDVNIFTDYKMLLEKESIENVASPQGDSNVVEQLKRSFLSLNDKQKITFMKWLLKN